MARRNAREAALQRAVVQTLKFKALPGVMYLHIPNQGLRSAGEGMNLKLMGMFPGAADLLIVIGGQACFLELKAPNGKQSDEQKLFAERCAACNAPYAIAHNIDEATRILTEWGAISGVRVAA